jgi:S-adenosylmethionine synthetase
VIVKYEKTGGRVKPISIYNILISTQHDAGVDNETIRNTLIEKVIKEVCPAEMLTET